MHACGNCSLLSTRREFLGRRYSLTDVHGHVVKDLLA